MQPHTPQLHIELLAHICLREKHLQTHATKYTVEVGQQEEKILHKTGGEIEGRYYLCAAPVNQLSDTYFKYMRKNQERGKGGEERREKIGEERRDRRGEERRGGGIGRRGEIGRRKEERQERRGGEIR
jgi:hypothetical protein